MTAAIFGLEGQVAVVTGGGTGIGRATARILAEHGADIALASRRLENLERSAEDVRTAGRRALVVPTDVREPEACRALVERVQGELGRIDILVDNAGGSWSRPLEEWTVEGFVHAMERIGPDPDEVAGHSNAIGRAGTPEEIAYPILFLVSRASSFFSGETIYVDGGPAVRGLP